MRRLNSFTFLSVLCLFPVAASHAQDRETRRAERRIAAILNEFNGEMRGYERELKYFQRTADFQPLFELRTRLVGQAAELSRLDTAGRGSGPAVLEVAREMNRTARELHAGTGVLEKRADAISNGEGRAVAARMKVHSTEMVKTVDEILVMFR